MKNFAFINNLSNFKVPPPPRLFNQVVWADDLYPCLIDWKETRRSGS